MFAHSPSFYRHTRVWRVSNCLTIVCDLWPYQPIITVSYRTKPYTQINYKENGYKIFVL